MPDAIRLIRKLVITNRGQKLRFIAAGCLYL